MKYEQLVFNGSFLCVNYYFVYKTTIWPIRQGVQQVFFRNIYDFVKHFFFGKKLRRTRQNKAEHRNKKKHIAQKSQRNRQNSVNPKKKKKNKTEYLLTTIGDVISFGRKTRSSSMRNYI